MLLVDAIYFPCFGELGDFVRTCCLCRYREIFSYSNSEKTQVQVVKFIGGLGPVHFDHLSQKNPSGEVVKVPGTQTTYKFDHLDLGLFGI